MATETGRPLPIFVGDHLALDFLNSVASPDGEPIEWLATGQDLLHWLDRAGLIDAPAIEHFRAVGARELDNVAKDARALREWLRGFVAKHSGKALRPNALTELKRLNQLLACGDVYYEIERMTGKAKRNEANELYLKRRHRWTKPAQLLQPLALAISDLVCEADFQLIRRCENPDCTLMFYDRTKSHARRWCSMAVCGNRAKVAAFRSRQK
jgi:predicted RNA-binding Zn ribbon-like protein